jgi:hypothetical protein
VSDAYVLAWTDSSKLDLSDDRVASHSEATEQGFCELTTRGREAEVRKRPTLPVGVRGTATG